MSSGAWRNAFVPGTLRENLDPELYLSAVKDLLRMTSKN